MVFKWYFYFILFFRKGTPWVSIFSKSSGLQENVFKGENVKLGEVFSMHSLFQIVWRDDNTLQKTNTYVCMGWHANTYTHTNTQREQHSRFQIVASLEAPVVGSSCCHQLSLPHHALHFIIHSLTRSLTHTRILTVKHCNIDSCSLCWFDLANMISFDNKYIVVKVSMLSASWLWHYAQCSMCPRFYVSLTVQYAQYIICMYIQCPTDICHIVSPVCLLAGSQVRGAVQEVA